MKIEFVKSAAGSDMAVLPVFSSGNQGGGFALYDDGDALSKAVKASGADKNSGRSASIYPASGANSVLAIGVGSGGKFNAEKFTAKAVRQIMKSGAKTARFHFEGMDLKPSVVAAAGLGAVAGAYRFDAHRTKSKPKGITLGKVEIACDDPKAAKAAYEEFYGPVGEGMVLARDLVCEPPNVLFPKEYARRIKEMSKLGVKVEVLGEKQMEKLGMNSLLCVGMGAEVESQMVVMSWMGGKKDDAPVCLVGKGVTFDAGGISLKPGDKMWDMKGDMGGSAAVVGAMHALAARKAKANVIGLVGLVENMPDGKATRPGDIVTSMSGQTIEVQNTDAEGRLVLADVLHYANTKFKPKAMVNLATLTGAIIISLGNEHAGLFSNNDEIAEGLTKAGKQSTEKVWRLPLNKDYDRLLDSKYADMKNIGGRAAGSITAAQFLQRFVGDTPWAHLDIAGTAWRDGSHDPRHPAWATGFGVRLLNQWVKNTYEG